MYKVWLHSDCDGEIELKDLPKVVKGLKKVLRKCEKHNFTKYGMPKELFIKKLKIMIEGFEDAIKEKKPIKFH